MCAILSCKLEKYFLLCFVKSIEESFSAFSVVLSNPALDLFKESKYYFVSCRHGQKSSYLHQKLLHFLPNPLPLDNVTVRLIFMSKCQNNSIKEQSANPLDLHAEI